MPTNEFDALSQQVAQDQPAPTAQPLKPDPAPDYGALLDQQAEMKNRERRQSLAQAVYAGQNMSPEQAARIEKLSREAGLGDDMVERNADRIAKELAVSTTDYGAIIDRSPKFAEFMASSRTKAAMVKDDLPAMQKVEETVQEHGLMDSMLNAVYGGLASLNESVANIPALAYDVGALPVNAALKLAGSDTRVSSDQIGLRVKNPGVEYYNKQLPELQQSTTDAISKGDYAKAGRTLAVQLVHGAPTMVAAMFTGPYAPVTFAVTTASDSNAQSNDAGADPLTSVPSSLAKGAVAGAVQNAFGMTKVLSSWEGAMTRQYGKKISGEVMREFSKTLAYSVGGEGIAQGAQSGANDTLDYLSGLRPDSLEGMGSRMLDATIMGGAMGGIMLSPQAAGLGFARAHEVRRANQTKDFYLSLGDSVEATKLRKRMPEAQREYIEKLTNGTPVQDIFLPREAMESYFQSKNIKPEVMAQELGILKEYNTSVETGEDMQIPLATWVDKVAGTEHYQGLADDIKFNELAPSLKEAKAQHKETAEQVLREAREAKAQDDAFESSVKFVGDDVAMQLKAAGYSQKDANLQSQLYGGFFRSLAERTGLKPADLYQEYGLSIKDQPEMQAIAEQVALNQAAKPDVMARLEEILPRTGDAKVDNAAREALQKDSAKYKEYLATLDQLGTREERAKTMGFDPQRLFHGTAGDISEFDSAKRGASTQTDAEGTFFATNPNDANAFADTAAINNAVRPEIAAAREAKMRELSAQLADAKTPEEFNRITEEMSQARQDAGQNVGEFKVKDGKVQAGENGAPYVIAQNPSDIRSTNAAFDPRFADSPQILAQQERGQIRFGKDRQFNIDLFKTKDQSTFLHESSHFFLEVMGDLASRDDVAQSLKDDYNATLKYLGVESRDAIGVEQHEQFARGFEAYLMEGKAPTQALRKAFNTFKTWLTSIYRNVKALDVELSPEIRQVFDRLIATDEQINKAEQVMNYEPLFSDPAAVGMNEAQAAKYNEARAAAREFSENEMRKRLMEDITKRDEKFYKEAEKATRDEVTKELSASKEYQALDVLQGRAEADTLPLLTGITDLKIAKDSIASYGKEVLEALPRGISAKDGVDVEIVADLLGFSSGKDMIEKLQGKRPIKEAVKLETETRMQERYPDRLLDPNISDAALKDVHNEKRADMLRMELEHMLTMSPSETKDAIRRIVKRLPTEQAVREQAAQVVGDRTITDIRPSIYQRAEVRASKEAGIALAKGDIDAAFEAKRKELLNHELYRAAVESKDRVAKDLEDFRKLFKKDSDLAKSRDVDMIDAARAVLAAHGIARADKTPEQYLEKMKAYNPDGYNAAVALANSAMENATGTGTDSFKKMRFDDFVAMSDFVGAMWDMAKTSREQTIDGVKVDRAQVSEQLIAKAIDNNGGLKIRGQKEAVSDSDKLAVGLMGVKARLRRVEHWAYVFDDGDINGIATRSIVRPMKEAETRFQLAEIEMHKDLRAMAEGLKNDPKVKITADEIGYTFKDKNELRAAILHTGNDSNLAKLLLGRGWGFKNEDGSLDRSNWDQFVQRMQREGVIGKEDYDFAQKVWDQAEKAKPAAQKAHKQISGYYFNEVTAQPFSTPFGDYAGGYVPAIVDRYLNTDAQTRLDKDALSGLNNSFMFPTTGRGFTKSRIDAYNAPLQLDLAALPSQFSKVLRFTHIEPTTVEVGRLLNDRNFKEAMHNIDPALVPEMLIPWLQRTAGQTVVTPSDGFGGKALDKVAKLVRGNASLQVMALNIANSVENLAGVLPAMTRVGPTHMAGAYAEFMRSPTKMHDTITEKSDFMKTRIGENAREISQNFDELVLQPTVIDKIGDAAKKFGYLAEKATNHTTEMAVWAGSYRQAIENGLSEVDAVRTADANVRQVLTDSAPSSVSRVETGTAFQRLFTMFSGWFNNQANLLGSEFAVSKKMGLTSAKGFKRSALAYGMIVLAPSVVGGLIKRAFKGQQLLDANEDGRYVDDVTDLFFYGQAGYLTAMVPGGSAINSVISRFNDKPFDDKINVSPAISAVENLGKAPFSVKEALKTGKGKGGAIRDAFGAVGLVTGLPLGMAAKPLGYLADVDERKARPTGPVDFTRGLITGKPGGPAK